MFKKFFRNITKIHQIPMNSLNVSERMLERKAVSVLLERTAPLQFLSAVSEIIFLQFKSFLNIKLLKHKVLYEIANFLLLE